MRINIAERRSTLLCKSSKGQAETVYDVAKHTFQAIDILQASQLYAREAVR